METTRRRPSLVDQVRQGLLDDLVGGKLAFGTKLPNENELAKRFRVSRATLREAVHGLLEAGYLARLHGSGTYVTYAPRGRHALETTVSYTAIIRDAGHDPSERIVSKERRPPTQLERELLNLDDDSELIEVERVRLADDRPVIYSRDRIPESLLRDIDDAQLDSSLYEILESAGHRVARASARLVPTIADPQLAGLLEVKRGTPLLHIDQVDFDSVGRPVMLSHEWHLADAFELIVNRRSFPTAGEG
jgi:DNA-binding GntR family transcriptional regulator